MWGGVDQETNSEMSHLRGLILIYREWSDKWGKWWILLRGGRIFCISIRRTRTQLSHGKCFILLLVIFIFIFILVKLKIQEIKDTSATAVEFAMSQQPKGHGKSTQGTIEVVGMDKIVQESHLPKLNFLNAVISDCILHSPVPFLVPRVPFQTTIVGGYTIPILLNVCAIQRDPTIWDNPGEFKPERFLLAWISKATILSLFPLDQGEECALDCPWQKEWLFICWLRFCVHSFDWKLADHKVLELCCKRQILRLLYPLLDCLILPNCICSLILSTFCIFHNLYVVISSCMN